MNSYCRIHEGTFPGNSPIYDKFLSKLLIEFSIYILHQLPIEANVCPARALPSGVGSQMDFRITRIKFISRIEIYNNTKKNKHTAFLTQLMLQNSSPFIYTHKSKPNNQKVLIQKHSSHICYTDIKYKIVTNKHISRVSEVHDEGAPELLVSF